MYRREQIECSVCGVIKTLAYRSINKAIKKHGRYLCQSCIMKQPKFSKANSERSRKRFSSETKRQEISEKIKEYYENNPQARESISKINKKHWNNPNYRKKQKRNAKERWEEPSYREKVLKGVKNSWTDKRRNYQSKITKKLWKNASYQLKRDIGIKRSLTPERRKQLSDTTKQLWNRKDYRHKQAKSIALNSNSILDNTIIGLATRLGYSAKPFATKFWSFDALIEFKNKKLLVECQGDYHHNKNERVIRDKQKRTYYNNYLSDKYDLLIIWEHEFYCIGKIADLLAQKLKDPIEVINYNLSDLSIKVISHGETKDFYNKFHYLKKYRSGLFNIAALLDDQIVALTSFGSPTRKESQDRLKLNDGELIELTRMCVHPKFRKKNLLSYLLSRAIKILKNNTQAKAILTFADTTLGHSGSVYKASNFEFDGEVKPTYWYLSQDGYYRHKKTVWDQAKRLGMAELDYAKYCKLSKIKGEKLLRFIYWLA